MPQLADRFVRGGDDSPVKAFFHHKIKALKGKTIRANFYKCGDKLTVPHYLTWSTVGTPKPDFHRPEFFGMVRFN